MNGWILLHKKILDWEWYNDSNTFRLFVHFLLNVNYEEKKWQGVTIKPGQIVTGRKKLAKELNLSEQEIRTSLNKLKATSEITIKSTNKFSVVTVCKWRDYQLKDKVDQPAIQPAINPTSNQQSTTTKESKEVKKKRNTVIPTETEFFEYSKTIEIYKPELEFSIRAKYESWKDSGWKDGNGKPIKNWKTKLKNTMPYLKGITTSTPMNGKPKLSI